MIELSERAQGLLRDDEVVLFDWHPVAMCCAAAGEVDVRRARRRSVAGRRYRELPAQPAGSAYAAVAAYPHLARRDVAVDARRRFGVTTLTSDLPIDFGLRISLGRELPADVAPVPPVKSSTQPQPKRGTR